MTAESVGYCMCEDHHEWVPYGVYRTRDCWFGTNLTEALGFGDQYHAHRAAFPLTTLPEAEAAEVGLWFMGGLAGMACRGRPSWGMASSFPELAELAEKGGNASWAAAHAPSVLLVAVGNWEPAFLPFAEFAQELDAFVETIAAIRRVLPRLRVVLRTAQFYCCRVDPETRRYSRLRVQAFNAHMVRRFRQALGEGGVAVWDVNALGRAKSRRARPENKQCNSNHAVSYDVALENQLLMALACGGAF